MERDRRKRCREEDGGDLRRNKERETTEKEVEKDPVEKEVAEFCAILRRMREVKKYFEKGKGGGTLMEPLRKDDDDDDGDGEGCVKKRKEVGRLLDLNTVPDEGE